MKNYPYGIAKYRIEGQIVLAEYIGRQEGFECCICGKGCNAFTFNVFHADSIEDIYSEPGYSDQDYETWGYGPTHIEEAVEVVETYTALVIGADSKRYTVNKPIPITDEQKEAIANIQVRTRYEAMDLVAKILGIKPVQVKTWASSTKGLFWNDYTEVYIDFSRKTGKVKCLHFTDHRDNEIRDMFQPIGF